MEGTSRIAVLIDAENVASVHADEVFTVVDRLGEAFIKRAYGDWSHGNLSGWQSVGRVRVSARCSTVPVHPGRTPPTSHLRSMRST